MAIYRGPKTINRGLILHLDAANPKSYPGSGTAWKDMVSGTDASLVNGPSYSPSKLGILQFDGANDYCQVASNGQGKFDNQNFTIEAWAKPEDDSDGVIFSYDYTSHTPPYYATQFRFMSNGRLYFSWNNNGSWTSNVTSFSTPNDTYVLNEWQHVAAVFTSGRQEMWLDGVKVDFESKTHTITYYNQEVWVGRGNWSTSYLDGGIATVRYYNVALSADEIIQNYNATKLRFI